MIKRLITYFTDTIFHVDRSSMKNPVLGWLVQQYRLFFYTARGLIEHGTMIRSAALTYFTLLSLVPILALVFAVVKGFGLTDDLLENLYSIFPQNPEIIDYILDFATRALARTQGGVVAIVGFVTLFWAVIKVFSSIEGAFNNIWGVRSTRSITRQYADYIVVVFIAPILWLLAYTTSRYLDSLFNINDTLWVEVIGSVSSLLMIWAMFTLLYMIVPSTKVKFRCALVSALVSSMMFMIFQWGYVHLQSWMTSYNAIYGSFAALPLLFVWVQISWQILLFGAELAFAYQNIERFAEERESLFVSQMQRRKAMIAIMIMVINHFKTEGGAISAEDIHARLMLPMRIVSDLLYRLVKAGLLVEINHGDANKELSYTPAHPVATFTIMSVVDAIDNSGRMMEDFYSAPEMKLVDRKFSKLNEAMHDSEFNARLIDLDDTL